MLRRRPVDVCIKQRACRSADNISCFDKIKCLYLNCQSVAKPGALDSLKMYCSSSCTDLLILTETWLNDSIRDAELSLEDQFQVFRCDRPSRGGGVCVLARKSLKIVRVELDAPGEFVGLDLLTKSSCLRILCCYISSSGSSVVQLDRVRSMCKVIESIFTIDRPLLVIGDFNLPKICWHTSYFPEGESPESLFFNVCQDLNLFQMITEPTHKAGGVLDLLLVSSPELISDICICPPPISSDHLAISFNILSENDAPLIAPRLDFRRMDEAAVAIHLNSVNWQLTFSECADANDMYNRFAECCVFLINKFTPLAQPVNAASRILKYMERLKLRLSNCSFEDKPLAMKLKRAALRYRCIIESNLNLKDSRAFYKYVNSRVKGYTPVGVLKTGSDSCITAGEKASALASYFSTVFIAEPRPANNEPQNKSSFSFPDSTVDFSEFVIYNILARLKPRVNNPPDRIPAIFYKKFALFLAEPLSLIFQRSYLDSVVPDLFRECIVTPIHKKGSKCSVSNYRPVAQGSVACRVFETILGKHLSNYLKCNDFFDPQQHGFVASRSPCTQLLLMTQDWASFINSRKSFHCIYFDKKKCI